MKCKKRLEEICIFFPNECSGCKNAVDAHKTNFDRIKAMSVEEMAEYIYEHDDNLNDVICKTMYSECPWGDLVSPDNCLCCIKKWLEREVQESVADMPEHVIKMEQCIKAKELNPKT